MAVRADRLLDDELDRMARWLKPLSSPVRLRMLRFLTQPHYLEEVAGHLKLTRQAARKHLDQLVAIGVLERRAGTRPSGPVTEYVLSHGALFLIYDEFEKLGTLRLTVWDALLRPTAADAPEDDAAAKASGPCFWIVHGLGGGQRLALPVDRTRRWTLGRDRRCDLALAHDPYISNRHLEVVREDGRYVLTDLHSTNGTTHNWTRLRRGSSVPLRTGDMVGAGKTLLVFWDEDAPPG